MAELIEQDIIRELYESVDSQTTVHVGRVANYDVWDVTLPDGRKAKREIIRHPGAAAVIPVDEDGYVTMVYQFRHPVSRVTLEIPAGKKEYGEDPLVCAERELQEEVGLKAGKMQLLTELASSPGIFDERIFIYLATDLTPCDVNPDEDEFLNIKKFHLSELVDRVMRNEIQDSKTIVAIMMANQIFNK
ncbi:MAG: NUDIX hydrolase [Clostridia bacterium]|nr:NUDIX hydrolase [Clostridia bacterium]